MPSYAGEYLPVNYTIHQEEGIANAVSEVIGSATDIKVAVVHEHSGRTIVEYAEGNGADFIMIASHCLGL